MRYFNSIVLDAMRRARGRPSQNLGEITQVVEDLVREQNLPFKQHGWFLDKPTADRLHAVRIALEESAELGLVTRDGGDVTFHEHEHWRIADTWQPPEPPGRDGGDGGGGGRRQDGPGGGDNDGGQDGGGLTEVLSHPVLFSLADDDFDALVDGLFEEGRS